MFLFCNIKVPCRVCDPSVNFLDRTPCHTLGESFLFLSFMKMRKMNISCGVGSQTSDRQFQGQPAIHSDTNVEPCFFLNGLFYLEMGSYN